MRLSAFGKSVAWNLAGNALPLFAGVVAIPFLIQSLGVERFGFLSLAWILIGYFSIFDFGIGRALTHAIAASLGADRRSDVPGIVRTAMLLMNGLGVVGAAAIALIAEPLVDRWLTVPVDMREDAVHALWILSVSLPFVISSAGLRGILEAYGRFDWSNAVRIPLGVLTFVAPLAALQFSVNLVSVVISLVLSRIAAWLAYRWLSFSAVGSQLSLATFELSLLKPLLLFGSWVTASNIVGPLMVYLDRFVIGSIVSVAAVAYYATPYEIVTKLWIIPAAVVGVLFPRIAQLFASRTGEAERLYRQTVLAIFLVMLPPAGLLALFANEGLTWWLGSEFASESTFVAQCLAIAVFINCLGYIAHVTLQSVGRADWCAMLHIAEVGPYLLSLVWLANVYGINGVAVAWLARVLVDACVMLYLVERAFRTTRYFIWKLIPASVVAVSSVGYLAIVGNLNARLSALLVIVCISLLILAKFRVLQIAFSGSDHG